MKLFPNDWPGFLDELVRWGELSIDARRAFLDGTVPGLSVEASGSAPVTELLDAGFLESAGRGDRLVVAERSAALHQVLKSLGRYPLFESPGLAALSAYLAEHYTQAERSQLHESLALLPNDLPRIAGFVSSIEWLQGALGPAAPKAARLLLGFFSEQRDHIPLRDVEEYFPGVPRDDLCAGIRLGIQRCVFFLGLRRVDLEPLVGTWPAAARRQRRLSVVLAPVPVSVTQVFRHPFLAEDMTSLLAAARAAPIPLRRGDEKPFSRFVEDAGATLLTLPDWLESFTGLSLESRIGLALQALQLCDLLARREGEPGTALLAPGARAGEWMKGSVEERRDFVVETLSEHGARPSRLFDLLEEDWASREESQEEVMPWIRTAFSFVPSTTFVRFADFAEYQAAIGSPLAAASMAGRQADGQGVPTAGFSSEEAMEELWKSFLGIFLGRCLLSLGGAETGVASDGRPGFRMTDVGRRLLGIPRDGLSPGGETARPRGEPLVVQPNYEIVFLSPSPGLEAELGRFCERIGRDVGVLFRISRQSLQKAEAAGMDAERVITLLRQSSRSPLPSNVVHEIRGWMAPDL